MSRHQRPQKPTNSKLPAPVAPARTPTAPPAKAPAAKSHGPSKAVVPSTASDPFQFSNATQSSRLESGRSQHVDARHRPPTSTPRTITSGGDTADGNVKSSAKPNVGPVTHGVQGGPPSYTASKGR